MAVDVLIPSSGGHLPGPAATGSGSIKPRAAAAAPAMPVHWRHGLPTLTGDGVLLRELQPADAASLLNLFTDHEVSRFLAPPPATAAGFRRFVRWTHRRRAEGRYACFAIVPRGRGTAVGLFQVRAEAPESTTAEWGFVLGRPYWGTGLFAEGSALLLEFAFERMGIRRLEARAISANGRANGALRKIGAVPEGVLRQSSTIDGCHYDTTLWSVLDGDWRRARPASRHDLTLPGEIPLVSARIQ
ncbi:MAG: GNAT family N-acetyltransferase [Acidobacteria bacterium]|nr:GNAT family N-acetyltransferase [Acidobacteriota bacterium]